MTNVGDRLEIGEGSVYQGDIASIACILGCSEINASLWIMKGDPRFKITHLGPNWFQIELGARP